jgi:hypothetical protein
MLLARSFPAAYLLLWIPAALLGHTDLRFGIALVALLISIVIGGSTVRRFAAVYGFALLAYAVLLGIVKAASCSAAGIPLDPTMFTCVTENAISSVGLVAALLSIVILAIANERRGSLVHTVNALTLPRDVRIVCAIAGSLLGEFRRASIRVHHATTAQGQASPRRSLRNLAALPRLAAATWASVLSAAVQRMSHQWSSEAFWDHYFPRNCAALQSTIRRANWDLVIVVLGVVSVGWAVFALTINQP